MLAKDEVLLIVTKFWKISHMGVHKMIRIFMLLVTYLILLLYKYTFKNTSRFKAFRMDYNRICTTELRCKNMVKHSVTVILQAAITHTSMTILHNYL